MNLHFRRFFTVTLSLIFFIELYLYLRSSTLTSSDNITEFISSYEEFEIRETKYKETHRIEDYVGFLRKIKRNKVDKISVEHDSVRFDTTPKSNIVITQNTLLPVDDKSKKKSTNQQSTVLTSNQPTAKRNTIQTTTTDTIIKERFSDANEKRDLSAKLADQDKVLNLTNQGKINVYFYEDVCAYEDNYNLYWNPLFPFFPSKTEFMTSLEDEDFFVREPPVSRRITGYITPNQTEKYSFNIKSLLACEFILKDISITDINSSIILRFGLRKDFINANTNKQPDKLFEVQSNTPVLLQKGRQYLVDITHSYRTKGIFKIQWKTSKENAFYSIPSELLSPLDPNGGFEPPPSNITYLLKTTKEKHLENDRRNLFHKIPTLNPISLDDCIYTNKSWMPAHVPDGYGTVFVQKDLIYPYDLMVNNFYHVTDDYEKFLTQKQAEQIVNEYMKRLPGNMTLQHIVFLEENKEDIQGKRYFIELDVIDQNNSVQRVSQWMFIKKNGVMCQPKGYNWNPQEIIYLLTPVKDQRKWIQHLVKSINDIVTGTNDKQLHLIMIDYNSTDVNVETLLKKLLIPYTYIWQEGKFNKVKGLNLAVKSIPNNEDDPLVFVLDLQLQLPLFIFDYIRKHTFRSDTTYVPILLRCGCGQHPAHIEQMNYSIWQEIGYGMISLYKSDWLQIGGMNETKFSDKWGGEDWDLIEQLIIHKIEVIHHRLPGYYHLYHSTKGTWDGTKLF